MDGRHHKPCLREGDVVSGQSKVEKAKYVHSENNLRKTLLNISESFRRRNKKLSDETEAIRRELNKLRQSLEKVRLEERRRITGEYASSRRPHRAERLLCRETLLKLEPFNDCQRLVYKRKNLKEKEKYLTRLRLQENRIRITKKGTRIKSKEEHQPCKNSDTPFEMQSRVANPKIADTDSKGKAVELADHKNDDVSDSLARRKSNNAQQPIRQGNMGSSKLMPRITIRDVVDADTGKQSNSCRVNSMKCNLHLFPPLERIPETLEPTAVFPSTLMPKDRTFVESPIRILNKNDIDEKDCYKYKWRKVKSH